MCQNKENRAMKRPINIPEYTFRSFLETISSKFSHDTAYSLYSHPESDITYAELRRRADKVSSYLLSQGLVKGDRAAVYAPSSPEWMVSYLGIVNVGLVAVPILPDFSSRESSQILEESGAKVVFVSSRLEERIRASSDEKNIVIVDIGTMTEKGKEKSILESDVDYSALNSSIPHSDDTASLIFTSGTTGKSKGVVLSHKNLLYTADEATKPYIKVKRGYRVLSILPMSHVYEFTLGHILTLMCGCRITVLGRTPSPSVLLPAFNSVKPHIVMTVPLIIEKIYASSVRPVLEKERMKRLCSRPLLRKIIYRLISLKIEKALGGCVKFFGIGGAPLDKETESFLYEAAFPYALGYGLTETSPLISSCGPKKRQHSLHKIGTVVRGLDVKILDPDEKGIGELVVKGPSVMKGYYNNDELNRESFTSDGYFKTGDLALMDEKGVVGIRGRSKTMILLSGGENIYPEDIESIINRHRFVEESLVVNHSGILTALVRIDIKAYAKSLALSVQEAAVEAKKYIKELIRDVNSELSSFQRIGDVLLQETAFERTPTLKIKRYLY